jgi:Zn-finger nucleic acid-binding protein
MPELGTRYPCPVCLGVTLDKVSVGTQAPRRPRLGVSFSRTPAPPPGSGRRVEIDHCQRCGGVWLEHGEIPMLRQIPSAALWAAIARHAAQAVTPCHSCHAPLDRNLEACPAWGWKNVIDCPVCDQPMKREQMGGIHLDVCRNCKGVWFDHHELEAIWKEQAGIALERRPDGSRLARSGDDARDFLLASLWFAPDLAFYGAYGAAHAVSGLAHAAGSIPDIAAAAPEAAVNLVGAAGEAAGGVFDVIASILAGLFDG